MRPHALLFTACFPALLATSCAPSGPAPQPVAGATAATTPKRQEMAALAFIAYIGESLKGSDEEVERILAPCLVEELARQPLTQNTWSLAWGPAVYKFAVAELDDNMLYVVRERNNPAHLAISTRGTNAKAILDWLLEDFQVVDQVGWPVGQPPRGAKISRGTSDGLNVLLTITAEAGPAPHQTLSDFLAAEAKRLAPTPLELDLTGHSLGGALSPTLALYLKDTEASWDPTGKATIAVTPLAGPTAGNAGFAQYSDGRIGAATDRLHNPFDEVPLAWTVETMKTMADLYEPLAKADAPIRAAIDLACDLVKDKGYAQIKPQAPPLPGQLFKGEPTFIGQVGWQHTCGYRCALGLTAPTFVPVTLDCKTVPPSPCPVCP